MCLEEKSIKPLLLITNMQLQNVYAPNLLQLPSTENMIKFVNRCKTWIFTTYIDVDFNRTDKIDIDFSKYPNLMNGICITNFRCDNNICDLSTYHFIKYVRVIGDGFMCCCNLTKIDLSPISHITSIDSYFLCGCRSLTEIDLSPLSHVTTIRSHFLCLCSGLMKIDVSPLSQVISIGDNFLHNYSKKINVTYTGNNKIIIKKIEILNT